MPENGTNVIIEEGDEFYMFCPNAQYVYEDELGYEVAVIEIVTPYISRIILKDNSNGQEVILKVYGIKETGEYRYTIITK